ncbi:MAG TPA: hypothetical protein PKC40_01450 [Saprospiraceae bacterium]|nr:hypothetical protein [Saprospiraceae bacterium]
MSEQFELSIVFNDRIDLKFWIENFHICYGKNHYFKNLDFFISKEIVFNEFNYSNLWIYEFSTDARCLFQRDNIIDSILILLDTIISIDQKFNIKYAIGNIETNSTFLLNNQNLLKPTTEMILRSSLIFVPDHVIEELEINLYHIVFNKQRIFSLFNPTTGILFSSECEKYLIMKDSIR